MKGIILAGGVQPSPDGLAQAFILGEEFTVDDACAMALGDNIFYGNGFGKTLRAATNNAEENECATVFGHYVPDPERFGVVASDENGRATSVEAADFVKMIEDRQGITISASEEIAYINNWIDKEKLMKSTEQYGKSPYASHLNTVTERKVLY